MLIQPRQGIHGRLRGSPLSFAREDDSLTGIDQDGVRQRVNRSGGSGEPPPRQRSRCDDSYSGHPTENTNLYLATEVNVSVGADRDSSRLGISGGSGNHDLGGYHAVKRDDAEPSARRSPFDGDPRKVGPDQNHMFRRTRRIPDDTGEIQISIHGIHRDVEAEELHADGPEQGVAEACLAEKSTI